MIDIETANNDLLMQNKIFLWIVAATAMLLLLPLIAMQFSTEVDWKLGDFVLMGGLLFGTGSLFVLMARSIQRTSSRVIAGIALFLMFLYVWAELAVGVFTNWGS